MNRISVIFAVGALGTVALTAGCTSSTSSHAGAAGGTTATSPSTAATASASSSSPTTASVSTPASSSSSPTGAGTSASHAAATAPSSPSHAAGTPCTTTEMPSGTWRDVPDSEGAGHVAADIAFQNTSDHTCTVSGFPAVSLLASNDHPLPTNVLRNTSASVTTVKVAPGAWVHAEMRYSPNVAGPGEPENGQCEPTTVHALAQLPGDTAWARVTLGTPTTVCEKGELQTKPFVSGQASPAGG